jgi:hypothetical protein
MSPFRCLDGAAAGPQALGILVPPSRRTLVILRPRALDYDLLPVRAPGGNGARSVFAEMEHGTASRMAQELFRALEAWATGGPGQVDTIATSGGEGFVVEVRVGAFAFLACPRRSGQAYQPMVFATSEEAAKLADRLKGILCPPAGSTQELYFNPHHFAR